MNSQIYLIVLVLALITVIPASSAQLSLGAEANQKLIEVNLNKSEIINVKHIIAASSMPVSVNLFDELSQKVLQLQMITGMKSNLD